MKIFTQLGHVMLPYIPTRRWKGSEERAKIVNGLPASEQKRRRYS